MKRRRTKAPLKAYQIYFFGRFAGIYVGRTPGQAKAAFACSDSTEGYYAKDIWPNLRSIRLRDEEWELAAIERRSDERKYWRDTAAFKRQEAIADAFNRHYPVGSTVRVVDCCEARQWPDGVTTTRTPAWASGMHTVLVSVEGQAGGMYIQHIVPLVAAEIPQLEPA